MTDDIWVGGLVDMCVCVACGVDCGVASVSVCVVLLSCGALSLLCCCMFCRCALSGGRGRDFGCDGTLVLEVLTVCTFKTLPCVPSKRPCVT